MRPRLLALQLVGNAVLLALAAVWLLIPDSHVWQLLLSFCFAGLLVISLLELHAFTLRTLRQPRRPIRVWLGALILACWLAFSLASAQLLALWNVHAADRAGYWNSRLSPSARTTWTFDRLQHGQLTAASLLLWIVIPGLLLPWLIETVSSGTVASAWRNGLRVLLCWQHWIAAILLLGAIRLLTPRLIDWHPYDSIRGEVWSALFRLSLVYVADVLFALLLCSVDTALLARHDIRRNTAAQPPP